MTGTEANIVTSAALHLARRRSPVTVSMTDWPAVYLAQGLRLAPLLPRSKAPFSAEQQDPATGWHVRFCNTLEAWRAFRATHGRCNLAVVCPHVQVDLDAPQAIAWCVSRGLSSLGAWVLRTGRGWRLFFAAPESCPRTFTDPSHQVPDFLAPGRLAVVPPSIHPSGLMYEWVRGLSPLDIPLGELAPLPEGILAEWRLLQAPPAPRVGRTPVPSWLPLVFDAIILHLEAIGCRPRSSGGGAISRCPLHADRNPSLSLHPERGWICFAGCGQGRLTLLAARLGVRVGDNA